MFKLLIMGILMGTLSNLTGIPLFPVMPIIQNNRLALISVQVDERKLAEFKGYVKSKF